METIAFIKRNQFGQGIASTLEINKEDLEALKDILTRNGYEVIKF